MFHAEELLPLFEELGITPQTELVESHLDISQCFQDGKFEPDPAGVRLLSFILRADWHTQVPPDVQSQVGKEMSRIAEKNGKEELVLRDRFIWIPCQS